MLHSVDDDWLLRVEHKSIVAPSQLPVELAGIVVAAANAAGKSVPAALSGIEPTEPAKAIAASLLAARRVRYCSATTRCSTQPLRKSTRSLNCLQT
jgi:NADH-quinone oxidoreductase subunit G